MDILKIATDWAKAELVSTSFFMLVGIIFLMISFGFWQIGRTDLARAYVIPVLVAGIFLMTVGVGLFYTNKSRISQFKTDFKNNHITFVQSELDRVDRTIKEYKTVVFTAIPLIILVCALMIFIFDNPNWRASMISTILMLSIILLIDGMAHARIANYHAQLNQAQDELIK